MKNAGSFFPLKTAIFECSQLCKGLYVQTTISVYIYICLYTRGYPWCLGAVSHSGNGMNLTKFNVITSQVGGKMVV